MYYYDGVGMLSQFPVGQVKGLSAGLTITYQGHPDT
jgi:hypothetical protein